MRRYLISVILAAAFAAVSVSGQTTKPLTLEWDNPAEAADGVVDYVLYQATAATGPWVEAVVIPVANGRTVTRGLTIDTGRYWFRVTARNWAGESDPSNVLTVSTNRPLPVIIRIKP